MINLIKYACKVLLLKCYRYCVPMCIKIHISIHKLLKEYSRNRRIPQMLTTWLLEPPEYQQQLFCLCIITRSASSRGKDFNYLCLLSVVEGKENANIYLHVFWNKLQGLIFQKMEKSTNYFLDSCLFCWCSLNMPEQDQNQANTTSISLILA